MSEEQDPRVTDAYRALGAAAPPRALDEAVLAASRKALQPWTRRWAVPLSLAAVLVLSVGVTLRVYHEAPQTDSPVAMAEAPAAAAPEDSALRLKQESQIKAAAEPPARQRAAAPKERGEAKPAGAPRDQARSSVAASAPAAPSPAPSSADMQAARGDASRGYESSVTGALARQSEERTSRDAAAAARAPQVGPVEALSSRSLAKVEPAPERELERIAQLRGEGRHDEADKALAEFRRRHPDFRISEELLKRVERR